MFAGLDAIDWDNLHHGHGSAAMFPFWIRALTAQDESFTRLAFTELSYMTHQGMLSAVAGYPIPFLIEILAVSKWREFQSAEILELLINIAEAAVDELERDQTAEKALQPVAKVQRGLPGLPTQVVLDRVVAGIEVYEALLHDSHDAVRLQAARLLAMLTSHAAMIRPSLLAQLELEQSERVLAIVLTALVRISPAHHDNLAILLEYARTSVSELVRFVALLLIAEAAKEATPDDIVSSILQVFEQPNATLAQSYEDLVPRRYSFKSALEGAICNIGRKAHPAIPTIFRMLDEALNFRAYSIAELLLCIAFPKIGDANEFASSQLTAVQREVLQRICANSAVWKHKPYRPKWNKGWATFGLPETQEELRRLIE
jgi:hypothetical protein